MNKQYVQRQKKITHSVICITYNQEAYIEKAISSLFQGKVWPDEVIIADDCSSDGTRHVIETLKLKYPGRIQTIYNPVNLGIYDNLSQLIGLPKGDLIHYLAGDDWHEPGMFEHMNKIVEERGLNPETDSFIIMPDVFYYDGKKLSRRFNNKKSNNLFKATLRQSVYNWNVGISRSLFKNYPKYNSNLGLWADFEHALDVALRCKQIFYIKEAYPVYRLGSGISNRTSHIELSNSFLKVIDMIFTKFNAKLDKKDRLFLLYLQRKHEAIVDNGIVSLLRFCHYFIINSSNGAKSSDVRHMASYYVKKILGQRQYS